MRLTLALPLAAALAFASAAIAEPVQLSDAQMDNVTAGFGANDSSNERSKFILHHNDASDGGVQSNPSGNHPAIGPLGGVGVPSVVPKSCGAPFACAFD